MNPRRGVTALEQPVFWKQYFDGDYKAISGATPWSGSTALGSNYRPMFNGDISSMAVSIEALNNPLLYNYQYDQLNRLVSMDAWKKNSSWGSLTYTDDYQERVSYDPNGNILSYKRNGNTTGSKPLDMDKLAYDYKPGTNQLDHVYDTVPAGNYDVDIDAQAAANYEYDHIGNLVKDNAEGITSVSWTVYGKISRIVKHDTVITYSYGPDGNRIGKMIVKAGSADTARTWYVRDGQGKVLSVYESGNSAVHNGHLTQSELHLYGSSRLGIFRRNVNMDTLPTPPDTTMALLGNGLNVNFGRGYKLFELNNHLGNVLVTLNDKKLGVTSNNTTIDFFNPQVVSAQDYYPFGMLQPGRSYNAGGYRYGFNGKENDNEVKGEGNQQDYGMRVYDPRLGKFLSVDPITKDYPWYSPYQFAGNTSIQAIDLDGLEPSPVAKAYGDDSYRFTTAAITMLSWVSGVDEETLANTEITSRKKFPSMPWTSIKKDGGGGVTTGNKIQLTENYFAGWHQPKGWPALPNYENGNNDEQSVNQWFDINGHETIHILQWLFHNKSAAGYFDYIVNGYINAFLKHDKALPEIWADQGMSKYDDLRKFVSGVYQVTVASLFLDDKKSEEDKIKQIKEWTAEFDKFKTQEERDKYIQDVKKKRDEELDKKAEIK
jgi:RHS repeat-associated protein